jgi:hypothetical protein
MHNVYISIDGEWHKMYEPPKGKNTCDSCSIKEFCQKKLGTPCTEKTIYKKVSEIK